MVGQFPEIAGLLLVAEGIVDERQEQVVVFGSQFHGYRLDQVAGTGIGTPHAVDVGQRGFCEAIVGIALEGLEEERFGLLVAAQQHVHVAQVDQAGHLLVQFVGALQHFDGALGERVAAGVVALSVGVEGQACQRAPVVFEQAGVGRCLPDVFFEKRVAVAPIGQASGHLIQGQGTHQGDDGQAGQVRAHPFCRKAPVGLGPPQSEHISAQPIDQGDEDAQHGHVEEIALTLALWHLIHPQPLKNFAAHPWLWIFPLLMFGALLALFRLRSFRSERTAFLCSSLFLLSALASTAAAIYPAFLPSTNEQVPSLTLWNTAAHPYGLSVGLSWFAVAIALVGAYFFVQHRIFSGKLDESGYGQH